VGLLRNGWNEEAAPDTSCSQQVIGVVIAILLGTASLAIGGYQAWVGYQQWKHPISSSG
jgi:hypothetical protein